MAIRSVFRLIDKLASSIEREYIMSVDEPFPNYHAQAKQLAEAKKNNDFLKSANAQVLQQTLRTLDRAWDDMKKRGFGFRGSRISTD